MRGSGSGNEAPAGDLESCAKDLGTYKFGHIDLLDEASWRVRRSQVKERCSAQAKIITLIIVVGSRGS